MRNALTGTPGKAIVLHFLLAAFLMCHSAALPQSLPAFGVGRFSSEKVSDGIPIHWEPFTFKDIKRTDYRLTEENGQVVVKAVADASASGLIRKITIDPKEYPIIEWRWKVVNILIKENVYEKGGDDYAARIYILFEYDPEKLGFSQKVKYKIAKVLYGEYPPQSAINYIWSSNAPPGLIVPNPYSDRSMMVVVESGEKNRNTWVRMSRNVYEDYREAFNEDPPRISGVAIMTDTDNTGESAVAYYGDILFRKE